MDNIQELFPAWEDADKDAGIVLDTFAETVRKQAQAKNALMGQMQKCINNAIANGPEKIRNKEFSAASGLTLFYGLPLDAALDGGMFEMLQTDPNNAGVVYSIVTALCLGTDSPYSFLTCAFITKRKLPSGRPYAYIDGRWTRYFMITAQGVRIGHPVNSIIKQSWKNGVSGRRYGKSAKSRASIR